MLNLKKSRHRINRVCFPLTNVWVGGGRGGLGEADELVLQSFILQSLFLYSSLYKTASTSKIKERRNEYNG